MDINIACSISAELNSTPAVLSSEGLHPVPLPPEGLLEVISEEVVDSSLFTNLRTPLFNRRWEEPFSLSPCKSQERYSMSRNGASTYYG